MLLLRRFRSLRCRRAMSTTTHLERTSSDRREPVVANAKILQVSDLTPTTKLLSLNVETASFGFSPGQWVDFFAPGIERVGGYTITSVPDELPRLDLAVKKSRNEVATWCHEAAAPGMHVQVIAGGSFSMIKPLLHNWVFIAGGVGINPIYSMLKHQSQVNGVKGSATLLFSASCDAELCFKKELETIARESSLDLEIKYFVTQQKEGVEWAETRRINGGDLEDHAFSEGHAVCVCGPPPMTDWVISECEKAGVEALYERWW